MENRAPSIVEGWNIERETFREAHEKGELVKLLTEFSNACTLNCPGCFTVKLDGDNELENALKKRKLKGEMDPATRLALLEEAHALGVHTVDIVGAGEPMIDPQLRPFVERAAQLDVHVNIFTHGAHSEFLDPEQLKWWRDRPTSFFIKLWSRDPATKEAMVRPKGKLANGKYTTMRDRAIENLDAAGFCASTPITFDGRSYRLTRLGADILVTQRNFEEVADLFRFCRKHNIEPLIKNFIPEGPTALEIGSGTFARLPEDERIALEAQRVSTRQMSDLRAQLDAIDQSEFGNTPLSNFYAAGMFCTQSIGSLYVPVRGEIYSCVGTSHSYGKYEPGKDALRHALQKRVERVGFGCFPRLETAERRGEEVPHGEREILEQK